MINRTRLWLIALFIILISGSLIAALIKTKPEKSVKNRPIATVHVSVAKVKRADIQPVRWLTGLLQPVRTASLHFEISGRLQQRLVESGQVVDKRELLLLIDDGDWQDSVNEATARLAQEIAAIKRDRQTLHLVKANRVLQEKEVNRLQRLRKGSLASGSQLAISEQKLLQQRVEEAKLTALVESADARLTIAHSTLAKARRKLQRTSLRAPFAGTVNRVLVEVGDYITPNKRVIELIDDQQLDLYLEVDSSLAAALQQGQTIQVITADQPRTGHIIALQRAPEATTYSFPLRIRLSGKGLLPGQSAQARLPLAKLKNALTVPVTALLHDEGKSYVFRLEDGHLQRLPVLTGPQVDRLQVIDGAIDAGDLIVSDAVAALSDGQTVIPLTDSGTH